MLASSILAAHMGGGQTADALNSSQDVVQGQLGLSLAALDCYPRPHPCPRIGRMLKRDILDDGMNYGRIRER